MAGRSNRVNKAQIATANRISSRYEVEKNGTAQHENGFLITTAGVIQVATTATLQQAIQKLRAQTRRPIYVAMTNNEGIKMALQETEGSGVGVMDSKGQILAESNHQIQ